METQSDFTHKQTAHTTTRGIIIKAPKHSFKAKGCQKRITWEERNGKNDLFTKLEQQVVYPQI